MTRSCSGHPLGKSQRRMLGILNKSSVPCRLLVRKKLNLADIGELNKAITRDER
jgi:hypothetical protein